MKESTTSYIVKNTEALLNLQVRAILDMWQVEEWLHLSDEEFREKFANDEFHLLVDESKNVLAIARINFHFSLSINNQHFSFAEFVGFVSAEKRKGFGTQLLKNILNNLQDRNIGCIGFCAKELRGFYEKSNIRILYGIAKFIEEKTGDEWLPSDDDDILILNLSGNSISMLENLNEQHKARLVL